MIVIWNCLDNGSVQNTRCEFFFELSLNLWIVFDLTHWPNQIKPARPKTPNETTETKCIWASDRNFARFSLIKIKFQILLEGRHIWIILAVILCWFSDSLARDIKSIVGSLKKGQLGDFEEEKKNQINIWLFLFYLYLILYFLRQYSRRDTLILSKRNTLDDVLTFLYIFLKHQRDSLKKCKAIFVAAWSFFGQNHPQYICTLKICKLFRARNRGGGFWLL